MSVHDDGMDPAATVHETVIGDLPETRTPPSVTSSAPMMSSMGAPGATMR